jgi:triosephosphate isomerase
VKTSKVTVADLDLRGKRVLMRVDFNVPIEQGVITDDTRIVAALPTIRYVLEKGCPLILMSHLGRPKGRPDDALSLRPVAVRLAEKLGPDVKVKMARDWIGQDVEDLAAALQPGEVLMLENTRFHAVEEGKDGVLEGKAKKLAESGKPDAEEAKQAAAEAKKRLQAEQPDVARRLAAMADVYVNDAFGAAHRRHVSTAIVAEYAKETAIGLLMKTELDALNRVLTGDVEHPMIAVIGGAKVSDKLGVLQSFLGRMHAILIGGGMTYTFLLAQNQDIGQSIHEKDLLDTAKRILKQAGTKDERGRKQADLLLPVDHLLADKLADDAQTRLVKGGFGADWRGVDIGPETIELFSAKIKSARTVVWNGPMGVFEKEPFAKGTNAIAQAVAEGAAYSVVGGGDSITAINRSGYADRIDHISTGGGASLEFLAGLELPGVAVIPNNRRLFIAGNWKMYHTAAETKAVLGELRSLVADIQHTDLAVCVPYTSLAAAVEALRGAAITVGAQNVHWLESGAFTGEISVDMLKELGAEYVILGHSERRELFGETDLHVNLRLHAALKAGLRPIVCLGETAKQREAKLTKAVVTSQSGGCLAGLTAEQVEKVTLAYEPVWAIGTGLTPIPEEAQCVHAHIRRELRRLFGGVAERVRILYGGSVTPENVATFINQSDIDGALVGGASLKAATFSELLHQVSAHLTSVSQVTAYAGRRS